MEQESYNFAYLLNEYRRKKKGSNETKFSLKRSKKTLSFCMQNERIGKCIRSAKNPVRNQSKPQIAV